MSEMKYIKTSLRLTEEMHEWYKEEAEKIGIPMNALIIFAMKQYQREEMVLPNLPEMLKTFAAFNVNIHKEEEGSEKVPS